MVSCDPDVKVQCWVQDQEAPGSLLSEHWVLVLLEMTDLEVVWLEVALG